MKNHKELYEDGIIDTTDGEYPQTFDGPAPDLIKENGQHANYWVLSEAERAKGFIRPVRTKYIHVGLPAPKYPLLDLTEDQQKGNLKYKSNYVKYEQYPKDMNIGLGRFWTQEELDKINNGCGEVTQMSQAIAETYARQPVGFYGSTMCVGCRKHLPVGENGEFIWDDGSNERVGT